MAVNLFAKKALRILLLSQSVYQGQLPSAPTILPVTAKVFAEEQE